jgi:Cupin-like domain
MMMISNRGGGIATACSTSTATTPTNNPAWSSRADVDRQAVKYVKRRTVRNSPSQVVGLMVLFTMILALWHHSTSSLHRRQAARDQQTRLRADLLYAARGRRLEETFLAERASAHKADRERLLTRWLDQLDQEIRNNVHGGIRWIRPYLLPTMDGVKESDDDGGASNMPDHPRRQQFLTVSRAGTAMKWEDEWKQMLQSGQDVRGPAVDYADPAKYTYPERMPDVPPASEYPPLRPLGGLMADWNHDDDHEGTIHETLQHFNYSDPNELAMAKKYRDAEVPFKLYNVPEIADAARKWTDEYVAAGFRSGAASGRAQESPNNYFAFFFPKTWVVNSYGLVPVRNNDWDYATWASHARYADATSLATDRPHFYWQSGVPREQHYQDKSKWAFISRDLPSFSAASDNFFLFHADAQKGIQCRFGERGVVAATHYDSGMNMVAMVKGAKRYILQPPRECSRLGLFPSPKSPLYRHSILNFAHMRYVDDPDAGMSGEERAWLHRAATAQSVETVLKEGEVLYIPRYERVRPSSFRAGGIAVFVW